MDQTEETDLAQVHMQQVRLYINCRTGDIPELIRVRDLGQLGYVAGEGNKAVSIAAYLGNVPLLKWLVEESGQSIDLTDNYCMVLRDAASTGQLETLRWCLESSGQTFDLEANEFANNVRRSAHTDIVEYVEKAVKLQEEFGKENVAELLRASSKKSVKRL